MNRNIFPAILINAIFAPIKSKLKGVKLKKLDRGMEGVIGGKSMGNMVILIKEVI